MLLFALASVAGAQEMPVDVRSVAGPPASSPLSGPALDRETDRVSALLRCPVCQGLSVNDSPAEMAVNMKRQVRTMLGAGYTGEQIIGYFETSYGEYVRLEPKREGLNWLVWLAPVLALIIGGVVVWRTSRRRSAAPQAEVSADSVIPADLTPWVERVRAIAYDDEVEG